MMEYDFLKRYEVLIYDTTCFFFFFKSWSFSMYPGWLQLLGSNDPPASAVPVAGTTDVHNHAQ
jgi:hypothetical protein